MVDDLCRKTDFTGKLRTFLDVDMAVDQMVPKKINIHTPTMDSISTWRVHWTRILKTMGDWAVLNFKRKGGLVWKL